MMRLLLLLLVLAGPAAGQAVRVTAGEHDRFTRVVLQFPAAVDWQIGRTGDGYELRVRRGAPVYDLTSAFDLIGRERVRSLGTDPETGAFRLGVACACHALPFALREDVVVIDVQDGPAPQGWAFETGFDGSPLPPLAGQSSAVADREPEKRWVPGDAPWDWRDVALGGRWKKGTTAAAEPVPEKPFSMLALEVALTKGFARAATQGLVDPVEKLPKAEQSDRITDIPGVLFGAGVSARPALAPAPVLSAQGLQCPADDRLAVQDWGDDRPVPEQMAGATGSLSGEFDRTQPEALVRAAKFYLYLGFGAETRALLRAFPSGLPDQELWQSLARLVDGAEDRDGAFAGMAGCDGAAALWAVLADRSANLSEANSPAVVRSFSALPAHLRLHLGPGLAERFMAAGDRSTAQSISGALLRVPETDDDRRAQLMQARLALAAGDTVAADRWLAPLVADPGLLAAQVVAAQIDLAAMTAAPVTQAGSTAVEAMLREADGDTEPMLRRALVLARALSGAFDAAFREAAVDAATTADLWRLLAETGPDEAVMAHALGLPGAERDALPAVTRQKMAGRLLALGFAAAARGWSDGIDPLLAAQAALAMGDARAVLAMLGPANGDFARRLKAEALAEIDARSAVDAFAALGDGEAAKRAARVAGLWPDAAGTEDGPWLVLAKSLSLPALPHTDLAGSRELAERATETEAAVAALLSAVPAAQ